jgi:hypothetical protein
MDVGQSDSGSATTPQHCGSPDPVVDLLHIGPSVAEIAPTPGRSGANEALSRPRSRAGRESVLPTPPRLAALGPLEEQVDEALAAASRFSGAVLHIDETRR